MQTELAAQVIPHPPQFWTSPGRQVPLQQKPLGPAGVSQSWLFSFAVQVGRKQLGRFPWLLAAAT